MARGNGVGPPDSAEKKLGDIVGEVSAKASLLVREEIELAKAEVTETGKKAGIGVGMFGAAGIVGFLAFAALTACFVLALALAVDAWLAALIVAAVYGATAAVLAIRGKEKVKQATPPAPQTVETVKEDIEWAKHPTKSASK